MRRTRASQDLKGKANGAKLLGRDALEDHPPAGRSLDGGIGSPLGTVAEASDVPVVLGTIAIEIGERFVGGPHYWE